jgi:hypothetical protein
MDHMKLAISSQRLRSDLTGIVLPLLAALSIVLSWPTVVQVVLTVAFGVGIVGTRLALVDWERWRGRSGSHRRARRT